MLEEIAIRGLGVIEEALLAPAPGFTVLTGETGAGKTMVLAGLDLLFGGRADTALVRPGSARAAVDGRLRVAPGGALAAALAALGAEADTDGTVTVSRAVGADGRSRAWLAGRPVPASVLAELAGVGLAVHGQSSQHRLARPGEQRAALDRYAADGVAGPLARYRAGHARLVTLAAELAQLCTAATAREEEASRLRAELAEVERIAPVDGEDVRLRAELDRLDHAEGLRAAADAAHLLLTGEAVATADGGDGTDLRAVLATAAQQLAGVAAHDPALGELSERLAELGYQLADIAGQLAGYASGTEIDAAGLAAGHERAAVLAGLARRHGGELAAALAWAGRASERLLELDGSDARRDALGEQLSALRGQLAVDAAALSAARMQAAGQFADAVAAELAALAMPGARIGIAVDQREDAAGLDIAGRRLAYGPEGVDDVEITLAAHPGAPARPLARSASGGELSRVMLALEVVFAGADPVPTMVFDEVDAGVGGEAAVEVGRRLALLARDHQVLCVTHLAQVAAFADTHLVVSKDSSGAVTSSAVATLDPSARVRELSRMLAGLAESAHAQRHAEELLALAAQSRC